jgi:hypothetical protein
MSAHICNDSVFATLGAFAALTLDTDAQAAADLLALENVRSVNYRYNESNEAAPVDMAAAEQQPDRGRLLELCAEYEYQACECDDYRSSSAARWLERIRSAAVAYVPGDTSERAPGDITGAPVYDERQHRRGYVVGTSTSAHQTYTLGAGGMQAESREELDIVWLPKGAGADMMRSREPVSRAADWLASRYNWPPITPAQAERLAADQEHEQDARIRAAELKRQQEEKEAAAFRERLAAVMPKDCRGVIVARLESSQCDTMTDYFGSKTERVVILGFSQHNRNNFAEMRKALAAADLADLPELAKLADKEHSEEQRENWSMGKGYYLQERGASSYSGWKVSKICAYRSGTLTADRVPEGEIRAPGASDSASSEEPQQDDAGAVAVRVNEERDGVELEFPGKPPASIRERLKAAGFRWSRRGYWYAKRTAERLALAQRVAQEVAA